MLAPGTRRCQGWKKACGEVSREIGLRPGAWDGCVSVFGRETRPHVVGGCAAPPAHTHAMPHQPGPAGTARSLGGDCAKVMLPLATGTPTMIFLTKQSRPAEFKETPLVVEFADPAYVYLIVCSPPSPEVRTP